MARTSRTGTRTDLALLCVALSAALLSLLLPKAVRTRVQSALRSSVAAPLVAAQAWAERGRQAISDHGRLAGRVDSLALLAQAAAPLGAENERLRGLLGLGQRLQAGFVATELLRPPRGSDEHTVLLSAGSTAGVRPFSALIVPEGLVGMVTTVDASSSMAILWTHPDFRVSATTPDGAAFGIVAAHLGSGADRFLLEMRGVPFRSELKPGTTIVSSGLGNVFPRGIPIGVVLRETKTIEGWARTYLIRPIVSPDEASAAMILLPARAASGVIGAWSSASASDASQRAIAAAGDSMLADSVRIVQERIAKLAMLDSLRRAAIYRGDSGVRVEGDTAPSTTARPAAPASVTPVPSVVPPPTSGATGAPLPVKPNPSAPPTSAPPTSAPPTAKPGTGQPVTAPQRRPAAAPSAAAPPAASPARRPQPAAPVSGDSRSVRRPAQGRPSPAVVDSASGRNRVRKPATKPPENPFRIPPAGRTA